MLLDWLTAVVEGRVTVMRLRRLRTEVESSRLRWLHMRHLQTWQPGLTGLNDFNKKLNCQKRYRALNYHQHDQGLISSSTSASNVDAQKDSPKVPDPINLLRGGNSDPFDVFSFAITPRVAEVITFVRDVQLPCE